MERHLTLIPAVALAVTTIIGGGVLALPGTALRQAGSTAIYGWALAAAITIPLLVVFAKLGARYPSAGGVAGFVQAGFGRHAAAGVEVMLIGTFGLGIPAIALSGGSYLAQVFGWSSGLAWIGALILLTAAGGLLLSGGSVSARVQSVLAAVLILALIATGMVGLLNSHAHFHAPAPPSVDWHTALAVVGTIFFAFTGWEMIAFTTGEYRNPRRDFPRVVTISFIVVVGVYLLIAAGIQATVNPNDAALATAPIAALIRIAVSPACASLVAALGVAILAANVVSATWGASRLVYSSASERLLPHRLSRLSGPHRTPKAAVLTTVALFVAVVAISATGALSPARMFLIAGQNFYLLYLAAAAVFAKVATNLGSRTFAALITVALACLALAGFNLRGLLYPLALLTIGELTSRTAHRHLKEVLSNQKYIA